jgi:hypothetical protein
MVDWAIGTKQLLGEIAEFVMWPSCNALLVWPREFRDIVASITERMRNLCFTTLFDLPIFDIVALLRVNL